MSESNSADGDGSGDGESAKTTEQVGKPTVVHVSETHDEYIGRGPTGGHLKDTDVGDRGWLGNPFRLKHHPAGEYTRDEALRQYSEALSHRVENDRAFRYALMSLEGKRLACFCRYSYESEPACHGDVIASTVVGLLQSRDRDDGTQETSGRQGDGQ